MQFLGRFELLQQSTRDDEVHAVAAVQLRAFLDEWERHLAFMLDAHSHQFKMKRQFIVRLIQTRPKLPMHHNCRADDLPGQALNA